jgi:Holliday junction resolvase RusA-like endonuclease
MTIVERAAVAGPERAEYHLPVSPSVNNLFATGKNGRRFISKKYAAWKKSAESCLKEQRPRSFIGPVNLTITLSDPTRPSDLDNRIKALADLLVEHKIIEGDHDKIVRKITASWGGDRPCTVIITKVPV